MAGQHTKLVALTSLMVSLAFGVGPALADPPTLPPPRQVTQVPIEFRMSVADLEKQVLRGLIQKIDPKAKPELPVVVKGNLRDLLAKASDKPAAKDPPKAESTQPSGKVVVLPAPPPPAVQPVVPQGRPGLLRRPIGSRIIEKAVIKPAIDTFAQILSDLPNLDYSIELRSFKLSIAGQTLTCELGGGFHSDGRAQPTPMANPPAVVRGDFGLVMTITKELTWNDSGKLELKEGKSQLRLDPDTTATGASRPDVARLVGQKGLPPLVDAAVDQLVLSQLSAQSLPDLSRLAPKVGDNLPFVTVSGITAYPLRSDGKDLFIPLTVSVVKSNRNAGDEVKIATKTGTPPEPQLRGQIVFNADGKPNLKLDSPK